MQLSLAKSYCRFMRAHCICNKPVQILDLLERTHILLDHQECPGEEDKKKIIITIMIIIIMEMIIIIIIIFEKLLLRVKIKSVDNIQIQVVSEKNIHSCRQNYEEI